MKLVAVTRQFIWLAMFLASTPPTSLAQNDIGASEKSSVVCRVALTTRGAIVEAMAKRMVRASELADVNQKAQQLRLIQLELSALRNQHGAQILKQIEQQASARQSQKTTPAPQDLATTRARDNETIQKWTRLTRLPYDPKAIIAGPIDTLISFENGSLKLLDLINPTLQPREIKLRGVHDKWFANSAGTLTINSNSSAVVLARMQSWNEILLDHIDLQTGKVTSYPPVTGDFYSEISVSPDGSFVLRTREQQLSFFSPAGNSITASMIKDYGRDTTPKFLSSTSRYMIFENKSEGDQIFDRNLMSFIDVQKPKGTKLEHIIFNPGSQSFFAIARKDLFQSELVEIDSLSGKVIPREIGIQNIWGVYATQDQRRIVVGGIHRGTETNFIYDLSSGEATHLQELGFNLELITMQINGPLALIYSGKRYYILDTRTGSHKELPKPSDNYLSFAAFSADGSRLWVRFHFDETFYELR